MKKHLTIFLFFIAPTLFSATHSFHIGSSLSSCSLLGKRTDIAKNTTPVTATFTDNKSINTSSAFGGIVIGYLLRVKNFGIGPEFFFNYGKFQDTAEGTLNDPAVPASTTYKITYKVTNQAGAHLRLGYFLESYFLYTLLGIHFQKTNFESTESYADHVANTVRNYSYSSKNKINTFNFGFGAQKAITEHYAIGLECKFAHFPQKNFSHSLNDDEKTTLNSSFKYQLRSVGLKLMYVF